MSERGTIGTSSTVTIGLVVTLIIAIVGAAVKITQDRAEAQGQIDAMRRDVATISDRTSSIVSDGNRITRLETMYGEIEKKLSRIELKLEKIDEQIARLQR